MLKIGDIYPKALVTGAGKGIGKAFTDMLLNEGVEVWGTSRTIDSLPQKDHFHPLELDLKSSESVDKLIRTMLDTDIDLIINNAGYGVFAPLEHFPKDSIEEQMTVLATAPIKICRAAYPKMKSNGKGAIVNIASLAADFPLPQMHLYNAGKAAISSFSRTLEMDARGSGVQIVDFMPGDYKTGFNHAVTKPDFSFTERDERIWKQIEKHLDSGPPPSHAAAKLRHVLLSRKSGVVKAGTAFQATIGPALARLVPWCVTRRFLELYFGIS